VRLVLLADARHDSEAVAAETLAAVDDVGLLGRVVLPGKREAGLAEARGDGRAPHILLRVWFASVLGLLPGPHLLERDRTQRVPSRTRGWYSAVIM